MAWPRRADHTTATPVSGAIIPPRRRAGTGEVLWRSARGSGQHRPGRRPLPDRDDRPGPICRASGEITMRADVASMPTRSWQSARSLASASPSRSVSSAACAASSRRSRVCLDPDPVLDAERADVAETSYTPFASEKDAKPVRLIVRRVRTHPGSQLALFASTTTSSSPTATARPWSSRPTIAATPRSRMPSRDLKYGVGLNHLPSGKFAATPHGLAYRSSPQPRPPGLRGSAFVRRIVTTDPAPGLFNLPGRPLARLAE